MQISKKSAFQKPKLTIIIPKIKPTAAPTRLPQFRAKIPVTSAQKSTLLTSQN
jgi:hypothetical protein